ncbi:ABC transporter ATP-binding protein [Sphingobacteriales bacterium UPWRP_1]|nr:multidrug ABC transporter ATP-binding protein [Sphingobacteriales bacterium TSM_CSM]PSJ77893.1 ABC transporter ATP-binding protein [Sphingobacteriales bacterium UPWRP_1]
MQLLIENLSKTYPNGTQALKNINLTIPAGLFGLLGPNGAGKSTLMRTIATLQNADEGQIVLQTGNGTPIDVQKQKDEMRRRLGYLPQEFGVYPNISAEALLDHLAILKGLTHKAQRKEVVQNLLQQTNLYEVRKRAVAGYSGGMKQRFGIAQALLGNPEVVIVDEPTAGLDPAERNRFLNLLSEISENIIIIFSTHIVEDVKELCNNMAIINQGEVVMQGNPAAAIEQLRGKIWQTKVAKTELNHYRQTYHLISHKLNAGKMEIHILADQQPADSTFTPADVQLEDVYFSKVQLPDE